MCLLTVLLVCLTLQCRLVAASFTDCLGQLSVYLVTDQSAEYDDLSTGICSRVSRTPFAIFLPRNSSHVVSAYRCARANGILCVPRSGGHSYEALSSMDNALVIDLAYLNSVTVLPGQDRAVVEAGARLGKVYSDLYNQGGYSFNAGNCPSVGVGGHITGGGAGFQSRMYGLAADRVQEMQVLLANASVVSVDATRHPDLFWALRGGGSGSFGIILSFILNIFKLPLVTTVFQLDFDLSADVMDNWQRNFITTAPMELTTEISVFKFDIFLVGHFLGPRSALDVFLAGTGIMGLSAFRTSVIRECDGLGVRSFLWWEGLQTCTNVAMLTADQPKEYSKKKSEYAAELLPATALNAIVGHMQVMPLADAYRAFILFLSMGGAINAVGVTDTPFPSRSGTLMGMELLIEVDPGESEDSSSYQWINTFEGILQPYVTGRKYQNYPDLDIQDYGMRYFGEVNFNRLIAIKNAYDPENVFTNDQSIPLVLPGSTVVPTRTPTPLPQTVSPSRSPTAQPSPPPTQQPTTNPTTGPTASLASSPPTPQPTTTPTAGPTTTPSPPPTQQPTTNPTAGPTASLASPPPTQQPTTNPTAGPTTNPTAVPTASVASPPPTQQPTTLNPSLDYTVHPLDTPTSCPTFVPSVRPSPNPVTSTTPAAVPTPRPSRAAPSVAVAPIVAFRLDNVQAWWCTGIAKAVIDMFLESGTPVNIGVIGQHLAEDTEFALYLASIATSPLVEILDNSHAFINYDGAPLARQTQDLASAQAIIASVTGQSPSAFVPPHFKYDTNTARAMTSNGLRVMSPACIWDTNRPGHKIYCPRESAVRAPLIMWQDVALLPAGAVLGDIAYWKDHSGPADADIARLWIDAQIANQGFSVVSLMPSEFSLNRHNDCTSLDREKLAVLRAVISYAKTTYEVKLFQEAVDFYFPPQPTQHPTEPPVVSSPPDYSSGRSFCSERGYRPSPHAPCVCDDVLHYWSSERCSRWHNGRQLEAAQFCYPNTVDSYCSWMGRCNGNGSACLCFDPIHRSSSDRCLSWTAQPPLDTVPFSPNASSLPCSTGDRAYCHNRGVCLSPWDGCVCDDPEHFWAPERCSTFHWGQRLEPGQCCVPGAVDYYCSWMGQCTEDALQCICFDPLHRSSLNRCQSWYADLALAAIPLVRYGSCPQLMEVPEVGVAGMSSSPLASLPEVQGWFVLALVCAGITIAGFVLLVVRKVRGRKQADISNEAAIDVQDDELADTAERPSPYVLRKSYTLHALPPSKNYGQLADVDEECPRS